MKYNQFISNFIELSKEIGFDYDHNSLQTIGGVQFTTLGIIKNYGSIKGTVLFKLFDQVDNISILDSEGIYYSFLGDPYKKYDIQLLKDTLNDWGYYGSLESKPEWYTGKSWS